ncbi:MAG: hypothetical protein F4W92_00840 [Gammaproteobacteria bacterium]|nr:hypothetical protein [Gammaproteobacteria bacterium]
MDKSTQELGRLEHFCTQRPLAGAALTALLFGLVVFGVELLLYSVLLQWPLTQWWATNKLESILPLFVVFYVIFSRFKHAKNNWDLSIDNLFLNHPLLTSVLFALAVGFSTMILDLIAVLIWNSSFDSGTLIFATMAAMSSLVICFIAARLMVLFRKDKGSF